MPRKTQGARRIAGDRRGASMRPRPDAAENALPASARARLEAASMRPRPDAAENDGHLRRVARTLAASMRPRPDAAENHRLDRLHLAGAGRASMRPRPDAAENTGDDVDGVGNGPVLQ